MDSRNGALSPIQGLWIGQSLGPMERCSIQSFLANGHPYHLFVYDAVTGIPAGTVIRDAAEVLPRTSLFVDDRNTYAGFSNLFRYKLLFERGGYWADLDVVCLRPFSFSQEHIFTHELEEDGSSGFGSCVIKTTSHSEPIKSCLEACLARGPQDVRWGELGPGLLGRVITQLDLNRHVVPHSFFCPIPSWRWHLLLRDDREAQLAVQQLTDSDTYVVHLWNEMWRLGGADKAQRWSRDCLYERLKRRYEAGGGTALAAEPADMLL